MQNPFLQQLLKEHNLVQATTKPSAKATLSYKPDPSLVDALRSLKTEDDIYSSPYVSEIIEISQLLQDTLSSVPETSSTLDVKKCKDLYSTILKQIPKQLKYTTKSNSNHVLNSKKVVTCCVRELKRALSRTSKTNPFLKAKKISKELDKYYRRTRNAARIPQSKKLQVALKRKEIEEKEAVRQKRKLNFLINQTELFSHFMMNKGKLDGKDEDDVAVRAARMQIEKINEFEREDLKRSKKDKRNNKEIASIKQANGATTHNVCNAEREISAHKTDVDVLMRDLDHPKTISISQPTSNYVKQPINLKATLKQYQIQGLTWLVSLYDQGINGILADDMGLGKTVQSIAFLGHLFESEGINGPFLIVTPASTLHNWAAEFDKFLPSFTIVQYWGSINERKIMRKTFHTANVIITSYQMVVTDEKIFKRIRWQYMILDEAQAIKSSASQRWRILLSIACRNRLLLTGTPIQNTMGELWALLHFIMPTLFDSHDEFSTWFSKDIEKEGKKIDNVQLHRLHMILKPFMLRREKNDVKDELGIKTEKDVYCEMSVRQKRLYKAIEEQKGTNNDDLVKGVMEIDKKKGALDDNLLNLVMQFRKVCNHPDLFEREEVRSGLCFDLNEQYIKDYLDGIGRSKICFYIPEIVGDNLIYQKTKMDIIINDIKNLKTSVISSAFEDKRDKLAKLDGLLESISNIACNGSRGQNNYVFCNTRLNRAEFMMESASTVINDINAILYQKKITDEQYNFYIPRVISSIPRLITPSFTLSQMVRDAVPSIPPKMNIFVPRLDTFITDSGKLLVIDNLLKQLRENGHRVLIYFQMTRMMDLMEDYLVKRAYPYCRLDGSCRLNARRDIVKNWQTSDEKFVFLLSTRAGGLGINLTAADTVIFYDSDWNPTMDQQAMDRAHRLGQTKNVTVYRLITRGTIEERVMERAMRKGEIQKMVIAGGEFSFKERM